MLIVIQENFRIFNLAMLENFLKQFNIKCLHDLLIIKKKSEQMHV